MILRHSTPRKNLPRLVDAYAALPRELQDAHPLVVVGARGWQTGSTLAVLVAFTSRAACLVGLSSHAIRRRSVCYLSE